MEAVRKREAAGGRHTGRPLTANVIPWDKRQGLTSVDGLRFNSVSVGRILANFRAVIDCLDDDC